MPLRSTSRLPFRNLDAAAWQNLGLVALSTYYLIWFLIPPAQGLFFLSLASDYLALWSAGHIAAEQGFAQVYRLEVLRRVQQPLVPNPDPTNLSFSPIPAPYLPVFLLPMPLLAQFSPQFSFWIWTVLNLGVLVGYLLFYARRLGSLPRLRRPLWFLFLSFPVFGNFFWGQLNVWLVICVGEFFWNLHRDRPYRAGVWLAGMLLKPQTLLLILPLLLLWRAWKVLSGFFSAAALLFVVSALLLGGEGMRNFVNLSRFWGNEGNALVAINPSNMMNWRMVAEHLTEWIAPGPAWALALIGSAWTLWFALRPVLKPPTGEKLAPALLRIFAATLLVTWHAHYHMAMILLPLLLAVLSQEALSVRFLAWWVFLPPFVQFLGMSAGILTRTANLFPYEGLNSLLTGLAMMGTTAAFLWAVQTRRASFDRA
ncbi:MAG: glycosyltransferase family 87 protein [Anaerolineales bacterium]